MLFASSWHDLNISDGAQAGFSLESCVASAFSRGCAALVPGCRSWAGARNPCPCLECAVTPG